MKKSVAYIRISTTEAKQSNSLQLQEETIRSFASSNGYEITKIFSEIQTGTDDSRPVLKQAIDYVSDNGCFLIALRVDRIGRSVSLFSQLEPIINQMRLVQYGDQPISVMLLSILLAVAKNEADMISLRVKSTFKMLREKGVKLGNPNIKSIQKLGADKSKQMGDEYIASFSRLLTDLEKAGYNTTKEITNRLNELNIKTRRGQRFKEGNVYRLQQKARRMKHHA
jgi:DNA invertase Pin-like site-specific DNA recombinase